MTNLRCKQDSSGAKFIYIYLLKIDLLILLTCFSVNAKAEVISMTKAVFPVKNNFLIFFFKKTLKARREWAFSRLVGAGLLMPLAVMLPASGRLTLRPGIYST